MLRDLTNPKKIDKQAVLAAIAALRARAWDINPYTVADEMKTARTNIYRNSEAMELVNEARQQAGLPMIHTDDSEVHHETTDAPQDISAMQERIQQLESENAELQELQRDNWQRGYKAGWDEASIYLINGAPFPTETTSYSEEDNFTAPQQEAEPEPLTTYSDNTASEQYQEYNYNNYAQETLQDNSQENLHESWSNTQEYESEAPEEATHEEETEATVSTEELHNILKQHRDKTEGDPAQAKAKGLAASKFARPAEPAQRGFILRTVPPDIRKSCLVLGIRPEELSRQAIMEAWKREITRPGTHPDQGGDSEIAVYLNTAKDVLIRWWETQEPKLGKQFGKQAQAGAESESDETEPGI
jgi:hypothetical protein